MRRGKIRWVNNLLIAPAFQVCPLSHRYDKFFYVISWLGRLSVWGYTRNDFRQVGRVLEEIIKGVVTTDTCFHLISSHNFRAIKFLSILFFCHNDEWSVW